MCARFILRLMHQVIIVTPFSMSVSLGMLIEWRSKALISMQRSSPATRGRSARCEGRIVRDGSLGSNGLQLADYIEVDKLLVTHILLRL
jgi:hypothetical protein